MEDVQLLKGRSAFDDDACGTVAAGAVWWCLRIGDGSERR
jgi:hypothetical protein